MEPAEPSDASAASANVESPESVVLRWYIEGESPVANRERLFGCDREEIDRYLHAVDELQISMASATISGSRSLAVRAVMAQLENEFQHILLSRSSSSEVKTGLAISCTNESGSSSYADSLSSSWYSSSCSNEQIDSSVCRSSALYDRATGHDVPADAIHDLRCIAERMVAAGRASRCIHVYASVRKSNVELSLQKFLGIEKLSTINIQRLEWRVQEEKIQRWEWACKTFIKGMLFVDEKRLCRQIFQGLGTDPIDEICFAETIKDATVQFFTFAEAISSSRRSPEKLFKVIRLYKLLSDALPIIKGLFGSKSCESISELAVRITSALAEAAGDILFEFEKAVLGESSVSPVQLETIDSLAQYVMNYVRQLVLIDKKILHKLIVSKPLMSSGPTGKEFDVSEIEGKASSILELHVIWIIETLKFKLKDKSRRLEDASRAQLFMMNNVHHIFQKITLWTNLAEVIGCDYVEKLRCEYRATASKYIISNWKGVLKYLKCKVEIESWFVPVLLKHRVRKKLKAFNARFEEVRQTQVTLLDDILDFELRRELCSILSSKLIPAYQTFLELYRSYIENDIKYSVEGLQEAVMHAFGNL